MNIDFTGRFFFLGFGGVARCLLPMLVKSFGCDCSRMIVIDKLDRQAVLEPFVRQGLQFFQRELFKDRLEAQLDELIRSGDFLIDLSVGIDSFQLVSWCQKREVLYINASVEEWDFLENFSLKAPQDQTLYSRHLKFFPLRSQRSGSTALLDHGINPGLVSHFVKAALIDLGTALLPKLTPATAKELEVALEGESFARIAQLSEVKTIHISERDSQVVNLSKRLGEFVNTWSIQGLAEEALAPAELGWGTHEKRMPLDALTHTKGPQNQICLSQPGWKTWVRSWVPSGDILGMVIRHGEAFTISEHLTVREKGKDRYRPTVHYAYCCNDGALASLFELEMRQHQLQQKTRIISDEIISGEDELGVLLMGHPLEAWWYGSILGIEEARKLVPGQNATTVQVAAGLAGGIRWIVQNPRRGVVVPDDLPFREILDTALPFLGTMVSKNVDWNPLKGRSTGGGSDSKRNGHIPYADRWQFTTFRWD